MSLDRVAIVEGNLDRLLAELTPAREPLAPDAPLAPGTGLTAGRAFALFTDQVTSRVLDVVARELRGRGVGYYTISSAGHENDAVVGAQLEVTDPCFLHYRSGAFMLARGRRGGQDLTRDVLLSFVASADDPVAGGRHKVWGSRSLWVPPQTSTIASHVPKAVGTSVALERARRLGHDTGLPEDAIVCCSFGDASANHATALTGINAARYAHRRGAPTPILFVCEDNGIGISVETPSRWIAETFSTMSHLAYVRAEGSLDEVHEQVREAVATCRQGRRPVFLHLPTVRLWGHAGSDVEAGYRTLAEIEAAEANDPLLANARLLVEAGAATPQQLQTMVADTREEVRELAEEVVTRPRLRSREAITAPLAPYHPDAVREDAAAVPDPAVRRRVHGDELPEDASAATRRTLAAHINAALKDEMARRPEMLVFGEDVGRKGGVYHLTAGLADAFGQHRVFDTLLDETTILGIAQGAGLLGFLPVPEIQYLAYLHNALDQLRGEAASTAFFSAGQFTTPMVVRVASFAYQKGFGGHFHNDNAIGALRDIPGLVIAAPSRGDDAAAMLRGAVAMAAVDGRVVCFLEPIALYHERDLHDDGDGGWLTDYPPPGTALLPGEVRVHDEAHTDLLIVTYANGVRMSLRAARRLAGEHGIRARVVDLRWLNPLPVEAIRAHAGACDAVLVADEARATGGGIADAVVADLTRQRYGRPIDAVTSADTYVPLGPAADDVLLGEDDIVAAAAALAG